MTRLFKRGVRVTAYEGSTSFFPQNAKGIVIEELRVQFEIELSSTKHPNTCHVIVTNCNPETRKFLETKPLVVRLDAGYDGELRSLFVGDLRYGASKIDGPNWETKVQLADGDRAFRFARVSRSYAPGTPTKKILTDVAQSMGLVLPSNAVAEQALTTQQVNGYAAQGPSRDELTRLLSPFGLNWSIQGGKLQILSDDQALTNDPVLISEDTGMKGSPEFGAPDKSKKPPHLTVRTVLYPQIFPGIQIRVQSRDIKNQLFVVDKVKHVGDTHGEAWDTVIEATPLSASTGVTTVQQLLKKPKTQGG